MKKKFIAAMAAAMMIIGTCGTAVADIITVPVDSTEGKIIVQKGTTEYTRVVDNYPDITVYNSAESLAEAMAAKDYNKIFELHKSALKKFYLEQPYLSVPYKQQTDGKGFYYNPPEGYVGKYGVNIFTNVDGGAFMMCYITGDWSDFVDYINADVAMHPNSPDNEGFLATTAYYANLPNVVYTTLVELLGQKEGTNFFNYLKSYANVYDPNDYSTLGYRTSVIPLDNWSLRTTDYGLNYTIESDEGCGLKITFYY